MHQVDGAHVGENVAAHQRAQTLVVRAEQFEEERQGALRGDEIFAAQCDERLDERGAQLAVERGGAVLEQREHTCAKFGHVGTIKVRYLSLLQWHVSV